MRHSVVNRIIFSSALILFSIIPAYIAGKESQDVEDKFFPDGRGSPSKGDDRIYRIIPEN
ncbi:MAG: hypothetical protein COZ31_08580 [Nitrospirae bacterium CG_4_10_14_3_um_filter_44_29]|nr:hypothetical protein [Nitrospirota bacterium]OIO29032.1 MAG: hypothetical protein AUJ60_06015 [Nitrospirae bacterium CG1_02_44_142]PIP69672.1 MAG: hypothetical protein COW90_09455 [Nitrospirae bacterium CG22_combo_CG10-13_8_21_14_all_44_11]PIV40102.1 MAG: hypothetical protein COS28_10560 [Nitrospirae bacterium CG02_land_8_20_14_3_00_44_33]PIV67571.1 MAG: hypothetical protein COS10_00455 [Nitrospirae bacterium CG01_land_8_20_14_3_00_44_22]PIW90651.1 MAG: hypothetical protein COZ93_00940 [Nit